jgi:DNA polymerase elongation subunit (family B)
MDEYINYKNLFINKIWDFKEESIKYCNLDCVSLYHILSKFNKLIFDLFNINIIKYPTLSSLAFGIFRSHFLVPTAPYDAKQQQSLAREDKNIPKNAFTSPAKQSCYAGGSKGKKVKPIYSNIHMLSGKIAENIRLSYTGGAVDMYIPKLIKGKKIYVYDVNSLYPSVMANKEVPIGNPTYFIGNIL